MNRSLSSQEHRFHPCHSDLCRVDILIEQIIRIDPKIPTKAHPISTSFSTRPIAAAKSLTSTNSIRPQSRSPFPTASDGTDHSVEAQMYTDSALRIPSASTVVPVLRKATQRQTSSGSASATPASEKAMFQPIEQQYASSRVETTSKPTVVLPRPSPYATSEESTTVSLFS